MSIFVSSNNLFLFTFNQLELDSEVTIKNCFTVFENLNI
jgi:hypothetical protein